MPGCFLQRFYDQSRRGDRKVVDADDAGGTEALGLPGDEPVQA